MTTAEARNIHLVHSWKNTAGFHPPWPLPHHRQ